MSLLNKSFAGLAGSLALTGLHQFLKKYTDDAPHLDQIGEAAVAETLDAVNVTLSDEDAVYAAAMGGNILTNAILFSTLATSTNAGELLGKTLGTGLLGAAGSVGVADHLLTNNKATNTDKKKWMTTGYYIFGALVSIGVYNLLERKSK